jgi:hypothetical protein
MIEKILPLTTAFARDDYPCESPSTIKFLLVSLVFLFSTEIKVVENPSWL